MELLRKLRAEQQKVPVLLLTARQAEMDKVLGLESGADDYVTKPFSLRELLARIKALIRRGRPPAAAAGPSVFRAGAAEVDLACFEVRRSGETFPLSPKEAAMLELLVSRQGRAVSRHDFLERVWDGGELVGNRTIDTHVLNLRHKLEADPKQPRVLLTVHGIGYRLVREEP
jgi:DNA-binding response OmpR family regulator